MCKKISFFVVGIALSMFAYGQNLELIQEMDKFYWTQRVKAADTNKDAELTKEEMKQCGNEFEFYLAGDAFERTDVNKNGKLDEKEIISKSESEVNVRKAMDLQSLNLLKAEYPNLAVADIKFLKQNPKLVTKILSNTVWIEENEFIISQILKDKKLISNPMIANAMANNWYYLYKNPYKALAFYKIKGVKNAITNPATLQWIESHSAFIKAHPELKNSVFNT